MERTVIWTDSCLRDMEETFCYHDERNGNSRYSQYLYAETKQIARLAARNPLIGHRTEYPHIRYMVVVPDYSIFYHYTDEVVSILVFWDNRRNPSRLSYIFRDTDPMYLSEPHTSYGGE